MSELKCVSCGHTEETSNKWLKCPECGAAICRRCGNQMKKEQQKIETLRSGSLDDRLRVTCPNCRYDMYSL
ncbi:MAG: hypothetical protein ACQESO_08480 [Bacillota bacterium]